MYDDSYQLEEENRQLDAENRRLEEENRQLEEKNIRLERNRKLKEKRRILEEKRKELEDQIHDIKQNKRHRDTESDSDEAHFRSQKSAKRAKLSEHHMRAALNTFFSSPHFAVAGASSDPHKYGHKVFDWYLQHKLSVTPINPTAMTVRTMGGPKGMLKRDHRTAASPSKLDMPKETSLSVITPPKITRAVLEDAKNSGVRAVWLQPGSFDDEVLKFARKEWPDATVAGTDIRGSGGEDGWCILVDGEHGLEMARHAASKGGGGKL